MAIPIVDGALSLASNVASAISRGYDYTLKMIGLRNTPEMQKADTAKKDQAEIDKDHELMERAKNGDKAALEELRKRDA